MKEKIEDIKLRAISAIASANDVKAIDDLRIKLLGKKGELTQLLKGMRELSPKERPVAGQMVNSLKDFIENKITEAYLKCNEKMESEKIVKEALDVTIPGKNLLKLGRKHPITIVMDEIKNIFIGLGYKIAEGPDVETNYYNFEALNIPENHPAKDEQDTFYVDGGFLLRTQTSPVQVRTMEKNKPPIKIIAPGRVFRMDEVDATHSPVFHQLEGLVIDKGITMGDLKGVLEIFARRLLGDDINVRFRPHHFPFTEPSAEMDVSCFACGGAGCRICKQSGWIELLGCGMVHPNVLKMSGVDPDEYSGFAFGMGIDRVTMTRFNISDLRLLFENDIRFLKQF